MRNWEKSIANTKNVLGVESSSTPGFSVLLFLKVGINPNPPKILAVLW